MDQPQDSEERLTRREMLRRCLWGAAGLCLGARLPGLLTDPAWAAGLPAGWRESEYYEQLPGNQIRCHICPRECLVNDRQRGNCGNKQNLGGRYYTLVYGEVAALNADPIEKKPFFHFLPGTRALSLGTAGCNFHCKHCQNWEISQRQPEQVRATHAPPEVLVRLARRRGCQSLAYTYNEPTTFLTFMRDTARLGREAGLRSVMVSNGYIQRAPLLDAARYLEAIKVDLKSGTNSFYKQYCDGALKPVQETIKRVHALGKWLEVVYLVVPGLNDSPSVIAQACDWLLRAAGPDTPLHFTRFQPMYRLTNLPATPYETLVRCHRQARAAGMHFVYVGNVPEDTYQHTYCPQCQRIVVKRVGYQIAALDLKAGKCAFCGRKIPGIWA